MPDRRPTPAKWPYGAAKPARRTRVIKSRATRGVQSRQTAVADTFRITPAQARLTLVALLLALFAATAWWLYHSPYLTVHEIEVKGATRLSSGEIVEAAGIDGSNTFTVDISAAQARVAALPGVKTAHIEKHGWTGATITVEERIPWGAWQINGAKVPIDIDGYVLDDTALPDNAPLIVEADPKRAINPGDRLDGSAIALADRLRRETERTLGLYVEALIYRNDAGLTAVLYGPPLGQRRLWVTFGDDHDYDYKVAALYVLLEQANDANLKLSSVDLRFGSRLSFN